MHVSYATKGSTVYSVTIRSHCSCYLSVNILKKHLPVRYSFRICPVGFSYIASIIHSLCCPSDLLFECHCFHCMKMPVASQFCGGAACYVYMNVIVPKNRVQNNCYLLLPLFPTASQHPCVPAGVIGRIMSPTRLNPVTEIH